MKPRKFLLREIRAAIYHYITAIRTLGRTELNTLEIAEVLDLEIDTVNRVIPSLKDYGVKIS